MSGEVPPLELPAAPLANAVLDSRDAGPGDLFVAFAGQNTDGHAYLAAALANGARAAIAEERGRAAAQGAGAAVVDCTRGRWALAASLPAGYHSEQPVVYLVDDSTLALQQVGAFQRLHRANPKLRVLAVTGSVGKTSTKELAAGVMRRRFRTLASQGNLNNEQGLPLTLLGLEPENGAQLSLFPNEQAGAEIAIPPPPRSLRLSRALDRLNHRFGRDTVLIGMLPSAGRGFSGTKIAFTRIPDREEFLE